MKYPIGVQSFEYLRKAGFVYVDKTDLIYSLSHDYKYVFLGRPRRFGKSLLMSTIEAYMQGRRDLFEGLAIESLEKDWHRHAVLHFDLNTGEYRNVGVDEVTNVLRYQIEEYEKIYGGIDDTISNRFKNLIKRAYEQTGRNVVVLIDEYDKPILSTIDSEDIQAQIREKLKSFYGCLKSCDQYIRFAMLTGVSKFGKVSVFSDLNNIEDISLSKKYATICGLTEDEILTVFDKEIGEFAEEREVTKTQMVDDLRAKYDGYRFSKAKKLVYNPFSLLNSIKNKELNDYWFASGTPTFLVKLLQQNDYDLSKLNGVKVDENTLYKVDSITAIPIMYQSGYLTVKDWDERRGLYTLGYPNMEVAAGFLEFLLPSYSNEPTLQSRVAIFELVDDIEAGNIESFMIRLTSLFRGIPYAHDNSMKIQEDQFRNLVYIVFRLMGFVIQVECPMSNGRSDAIVWTADRIYVIEFKVDSIPEKAVEQILEKGYAETFRADGREVVLIGVNYSTTKRGITGYKVI